jgi:hypothetical protein
MTMEINLTQTTKQIISAFLLIILPLILIGLGVLFEIIYALYYVLTIIWFGMGVIFFSAINQS